MKKILSTLLFFTSLVTYSQQKKYRCFENDDNDELKLSVEYLDDSPISIKYKGNNSPISLKKINGSYKSSKGFSSFTESYSDINGEMNGQYNFTHSGNYDYIEYVSKEGKKSNYTINLDNSVNSEGDGYRTTPCF